MTIVNNRYDFVLLFDVADGNPNGDPDAGNMPRVDPETLQGFVTDACLKRKVRDYIQVSQDKPGMEIYVKHAGILANEQRRAYEAVNADPGLAPNLLARAWMCKNFFDVRAFGAVMTTGKAPNSKQWNCGQVRGPLQMTFARSIEPVLGMGIAQTRVALTNADDTKRGRDAGDSDRASSGTFARKNMIPYGLYRAHGFVSPGFAADTGFGEEDLDTFWQALLRMFEDDRSASRGLMATRKLIVFKHESRLGNAPSHELFDRVQVARKDAAKPARCYADYEVTIDREGLPGSITIDEPTPRYGDA